jgi:hypothetical protein
MKQLTDWKAIKKTEAQCGQADVEKHLKLINMAARSREQDLVWAVYGCNLNKFDKLDIIGMMLDKVVVA